MIIIELLFIAVIWGLVLRIKRMPSGCTQDCYQGRRCTCKEQ